MKQQSEPSIIITADGSHSLFVPELNEHYHSTYGAIQESKHVYIEAGLNYILSQGKTEINLLEIGFGTGLNVLLTYARVASPCPLQGERVYIRYTTLETFPLLVSTISQLNYPSLIGEPELKSVFEKIHLCEWEKDISFNEFFTLKKINQKIQEAKLEEEYDLVYFDAFGPPVQPEMWTKDIFEKIYSVLNPGAVMVTYCSKGEVQRTLKSVGFVIEKIPGPPGKREMVRAVK